KTALSVLDIDRIRQGVDQRAQDVSLFRQRLLGFLADHELADLATNVRHHVEQVLVRLLDLPAEEFDHTENLTIDSDGETEGRMQPVSGSNVSSREVCLLNHVGNPRRFADGPD